MTKAARVNVLKCLGASTLNDSDHRDEIVRLEAQIDELAARVESWFDPSVIAGAVAAVLAGIVAAGSNRSTAKEATHELAAAEAKRAALIRDGRQ